MTVCIANIKSGVGKTTLSILLSRYAALKGRKVLLIDADPQGTATVHGGPELFDAEGRLMKGLPYLIEQFVNDGRVSGQIAIQAIHQVDKGRESFYLLPNSIESSDYDFVLRARSVHGMLFSEVLACLPKYFTVIDCPPYVSSFTASALAVSDVLIIPAETTPQAVGGVKKMLVMLEQYKKWKLTRIETVIIVPTKVRKTTESQAVLDYLREAYGELVMDEVLPFTVTVNKVFSRQLKVSRLIDSPSSKPEKAIAEVLARLYEKIKAVEDEQALVLQGGGTW